MVDTNTTYLNAKIRNKYLIKGTIERWNRENREEKERAGKCVNAMKGETKCDNDVIDKPYGRLAAPRKLADHERKG
tara:strand:+ start:512 stop:739 length:228 start_codon:yes stop_codon:yes gene_type:complete